MKRTKFKNIVAVGLAGIILSSYTYSMGATKPSEYKLKIGQCERFDNYERWCYTGYENGKINLTKMISSSRGSAGAYDITYPIDSIIRSNEENRLEKKEFKVKSANPYELVLEQVK